MTEESQPPPILFKVDLQNTIVTEVLEKLKINDDSHDVCIQSDGRKFMVHREVLIAASNFFSDILKSPAHVHSKKVVINLPSSLTADSVENVIHFIYSGELKVTMETVSYLRVAARLFNLQNVICLCDKYENMNGSKKAIENSINVSCQINKNSTLKDIELSNKNKLPIQRASPALSELGTSSLPDLSVDSYTASDKLSDIKVIVKQAILDKIDPDSLVKNGLVEDKPKNSSISEKFSNDIEIIDAEDEITIEEPSPIILIDSVRSLEMNSEQFNNKSEYPDSELAENITTLETIQIKKEPLSNEDERNYCAMNNNNSNQSGNQGNKVIGSPPKKKHILRPKTFLRTKEKMFNKNKRSHPVNINFNNGENITFEHQDPASIINKLLQGNSTLTQYPINITFNNVVVNQLDSETGEVSKCHSSSFYSSKLFSDCCVSKNTEICEFWSVVYNEQNHKFFQCNFCRSIFHSVNLCADHIKQKHILNRYIPSSRFCCSSDMNFHNLIPRTIYKCGNKCHTCSSTMQKSFLCKLCGKRFNLQSLLLKHKYRKHDVSKEYDCKSCSYKCNNYWSMKMHLSSHVNKKMYKCSQCSYHASTATDLQIHLLKRHNVE